MEDLQYEEAISRKGPLTPWDDLEQRQIAERVWSAVDELPEGSREAVLLHYLGGLNDQEIAETLDISASAVRSRLQYGRDRLRDLMLPLAEEVLAREQRTSRFVKAVMAALPLVLPRPSSAATTTVGLTIKELLMFSTGIVVIVGLLGVIWVRETRMQTHEVPVAKPVRLATEEQRARLLAALSAESDNPVTVEEDQAMSRDLEIELTRNWSTVVGTIYTMLRAAGHSDWSEAKLQGVLGHAFSFEMKKGAGEVWQEANLDYVGLFTEMLPHLGCRIRRFEAEQKEATSDFGQLKADAWHAVQQSIDRGVPAIAWQPMSLEQKAEGLRAGAWGLLSGYDIAEKTYTVHHQYVGHGREPYTVRYDAIGHTDPREWFRVLVYDGPEPADLAETHRLALRNAVAFAHDTRFDPEGPLHGADARGFAAYELWRQAIESSGADPALSRNHAGWLIETRRNASAYLRELFEILPSVGTDLEEAAGQYDRVVQEAGNLQHLLGRAVDNGGFAEDTRRDASVLVAALLQSERDAIEAIQRALDGLDRSR